MIEAAFRTLLLADAVVSSLVGTRVYNRILPQKPDMPAITITKIDKVTDVLLDASAVGPNVIRMQVDCWAGSVDGVRALAVAVNGSDDQSSRGALHGFSGRVLWTADDGSAASMRLALVRLLLERATDYEPETKLYRVGADYSVNL